MVFAGLKPSFEDFEEEKIIEELWNYYQDQKVITAVVTFHDYICLGVKLVLGAFKIFCPKFLPQVIVIAQVPEPAPAVYFYVHVCHLSVIVK